MSSSGAAADDEAINIGDDGVDEFEAFFGRFWSELSVFSFDRGREIAEKEKERALKKGSSSGFTWVIITTALAQLSQTEKAYVNLTFLAPKGFLRKDSNLKSILDSVKLDLKKISESSVTSLPAKHSYPEVAAALLVLINLRLEMMEFYEKLSLYGSAKNVEISDLITDIETILENFSEEQNSIGDSVAILQGILNSVNWELQTMCNLLKVIHAVQTWSYLDATVGIQLANSNLQEWSELVQSNSTTVRKSSFYSSTPTLPTLFLWIKKLKGMLISKYTLYFYELLSKHSNSNYDIRNYCTKLPVDYYSRISVFQKKSDALCICIVFDARETSFYRNGYRFPGREVELVEGLDSFPSIVSVPAKPVQHWPSIVMIISDKANELAADKTVAIFDSRIQVTYFVHKIDVRMFLLIMYEAKKSEKDAYTLKFLTDLAFELRFGAKIFSSLKCFRI
ncbi:KICSTOR complex protein C12orf66 isoform X2 [Folsomia candida]|uniref:Uncharacterized protein n=1 Tax=Folsomia candida TaxID=158441 RepID=A0A226EVN9_FOLCA|nr:KICSTOR complex protein C12orf66 isoform X2 [Folsomia candida]XP_035702203.1 KICSTOR complex protein C12orf66 isoform X2 [Folsomia candida]XP_035702204.1 KICSTOR complex protein C12orf66 isoform X2 [Folsomia candida]OXA61695.1 hypothetical protein Fcan01_02938 [Folsomia candida]